MDLLFEVLALVDAVESRSLTGYEATAQARARFAATHGRSTIRITRARVAAYQEQVAAEHRKRERGRGV